MSYLAFYRKLQLQEVYKLDGETRDIEPLGATVHKPSLSLSRLFSTQRSAPAQFTYNQKAVTETLMFWARLTQKERSRRPCEGRGKGADRRNHSENNQHNQTVKPNLYPDIISFLYTIATLPSYHRHLHSPIHALFLSLDPQSKRKTPCSPHQSIIQQHITTTSHHFPPRTSPFSRF
jgi:hypothetical protein